MAGSQARPFSPAPNGSRQGAVPQQRLVVTGKHHLGSRDPVVETRHGAARGSYRGASLGHRALRWRHARAGLRWRGRWVVSGVHGHADHHADKARPASYVPPPLVGFVTLAAAARSREQRRGGGGVSCVGCLCLTRGNGTGQGAVVGLGAVKMGCCATD